MPNFGERPTSTNRDRISENEESAENTKKQLADALAAEDYAKVAELGGQMKSLQGQKEEFINKDEEEAHAENAERDMMEEAKSEDAERTKEKEESAARAKELEKLKLKDETESAVKIEKILKQINGSSSKKEVAGRAGFTPEEISKYGIRTDEENERAVKTTNEQLKNYTDAQKIENEKTPSEALKETEGSSRENPHLKYSYSNPEEYRQSLKKLQKDEQDKIIGFVGKINDDSIRSKELFDLQELMFRSQGSMGKEMRDKIWEDIESVKKRRKEKSAVKVDKKEPSAEDIESAKKIFGKVLRGPETSEQFAGSKIFLFEGPDNKKRYYAIRRNSDGQLEGNEFSLMEKEDGQWKNFVSTGLHRLDQHDPNISVGPTYQMHDPQLEKMEALLQYHNIEI